MSERNAHVVIVLQSGDLCESMYDWSDEDFDFGEYLGKGTLKTTGPVVWNKTILYIHQIVAVIIKKVRSDKNDMSRKIACSVIW